jgi:hypothetical protein
LKSKFFVLILFCFSIQNCLPPPEQWEDIESDYDHVLNVLGIISLDEEVPSFVGLYRTTDLGELSQINVGSDTISSEDDFFEKPIYEPAALIKDAIVQISDGQNAFEFSFVETEIFYDTVNFTIGGIDYQFIDTLDIPINYYKDTLGIFEPQSGVNYSLTIQASGYDPVTGSLKTPIPPELNDGLIPDTIVSRSTFEIHWDSWEDTTKGFLSGSVVEEDKDSWEEGKNWCRSYFERVVNLSDSLYTVPTDFCEESQDSDLISADYFIRLTAMDNNYFNYFIRGEVEDYSNFLINNPMSKGRSVGIEGGFGVFGSIASDTLSRIVVP